MTISEKAWDGSAGRFTPEQWKASCILHTADDLNKSSHKLPIKEPDGALSRAGVHAAASRFGSVQAPGDAKAKAMASLRGAYNTLGEEPPEGLKASVEFYESLAAKMDEKDPQVAPQEKAVADKHTAVVALPPKDHPVNKVGEIQKHVTLAHMRGVQDPQAIKDHVAAVARIAKSPAMAHVAGKARIGPDGVHALLLNSHDVQSLHSQVNNSDAVRQHTEGDPEQHPNFIPHMTTSAKPDEPEGTDDVSEVPLDRLGVWHGDDQTEYPLGGDVPDETKAPGQKAAWQPIPIHAVLAPEDVWSGDKRKFNKGSLSNRPVPLPFTWQKVSAAGHDGNVVVAKMEKIGMHNGQQVMAGHMLTNPEADEFTGLLAEFGRFGVSVDADKVVFDLENSGDQGVAFAEARTSAACACAIPAFAEAWCALGEPPEEWGLGEVEEMPDEALVASMTAAGMPMTPDFIEALGRGPGWVTNPKDTARIHAYWTTPGEPGYAKVGWGTDGDYGRCLSELGEEIGENSPDKLRFMHQICAQWQHDAIGVWPGKGEKASVEDMGMSDVEPAPAVSLVAAAPLRAPAAFFKPLDLKEPTALTVTDEMEVYGHVATFGTCHIGFKDVCMEPPTDDDFRYFASGQVALDDGTRANTGVISLGGGHAGPHASLRAAVAHYDSTSTAACDVTVGMDSIGIWVHGWVRPGVTDEQVTALMASKVSGDWRPSRGKLTLVAVLAVNVNGFYVPRVAAANGEQVSLVAAGMVTDDPPSTGVSVSELARLVAAEMREMENRKHRIAELASAYAAGPSYPTGG